MAIPSHAFRKWTSVSVACKTREPLGMVTVLSRLQPWLLQIYAY
jgi:hypothetical protein